MLGFEAPIVRGEPVAADGELEDARWFTRAELIDAAAERGEFCCRRRWRSPGG
jgi:NADH pyrophosphatase NudC (nudix superfamily)